MVAQNPDASVETEKRPTFGQYPFWLIREKHLESIEIHKNQYEAITPTILNSFKDSNFWQAVVTGLKNLDAQYLIDHKYPLIAEFEPELVIKPWRSFLEKTYRKNILTNKFYPSPPEGGWVILWCALFVCQDVRDRHS